MSLSKSFTSEHKISFNGEDYIFDPFYRGIGAWKFVSNNHIVNNSLQETLNKLVFGEAILPNMLERFKKASKEERSKLQKISMEWLISKIKGIKNEKFTENVKTTSTFIPGRLYFFIYTAKLKNELPLWDRFPLVVPLELYKDGFLGINFHYLNEKNKLEVLNFIITKTGVLTGDENSILQLNLNYKILSALSRYKELQPCIKRYLYSNINSRILPVESHEWVYSILTPSQEFMSFNNKAVK